MRSFSMTSGLVDAMERRERTSFSIFPLSRSRWCFFIHAFCFTGMGWLTVRLALAAYSFLLDHWHSGPIHFDIENRNRLADDGQIELDRFLDFLTLTLSDIRSNSFCCALHRLCSHLHPGQDFDLFAAMIEGSILAHKGEHTAHPGREL